MSTETPTPPAQPELPATPRKYVPAVSGRLKKVLYVVFALVALLGANGAYLSTITALQWATGQTYENHFYQFMFLAHLVLGLILLLPFLAFGTFHLLAAKDRRNRRAVKVGYALFAIGIAVLVSGLMLVRIEGVIDIRSPQVRTVTYWAHVVTPIAAVWMYWLHRLTGPRIKWKIGIIYALGTAAVVALMAGLHAQDPRQWNVAGSKEGVKYFEPSLARTSTGNFIPADKLMDDAYCKKCHADVHAGWEASVHRISSFNNPPYLSSVMETRNVSLKRDGSVKASRWCAGCHDPVPFFSGAFDDPNFDVQKHPTSQAGVTCTVCHAITHVNSTKGNADYVIEEPLHYPFAYSDNATLQWMNNVLVKSKPAFHKKTFLKPFHKSAEFCSTCHKVHLPYELNHYKEFMRGQNHYDAYLLSGVSGHGARSFYYPPKARENCNTCHMPLQESNDFGARLFADAKKPSIHNHLFPAANTGIAWLRDKPEIIQAHQDFQKGVMRVDIFGVREGGEIDGKLNAPLRPAVPTLKRNEKYLLETVVRTLKMGHAFTQGTVDSNEVWVEVKLTSGDRVIGMNGALDATRGNEVDPWAHFINVFMLDRNGNRIDRRNPQDIFTPLYNHQIPPGAATSLHYEFKVPDDVTEPIKAEVKLQYRKFDQRYMDFVAKATEKLNANIRGHKPGKDYFNELPITTLAMDTITFPVEGVEKAVEIAKVEFPVWQRWNDYGIGLLLKGKAELRQAADAFVEVEKLKRWDGPLNQARVFNVEGRLDEAVDALNRANAFKDEPEFPRWTWAWLSGWVAAQQGHFDDSVRNLTSVLEDKTPNMVDRGFDFSLDYEVINLLGQSLFDLGNQRQRQGKAEEARELWSAAVARFEKTLTIDRENVAAHHGLDLCYEKLGDSEKAKQHRTSHLKYKADDNAEGLAVRAAREKYPAANFAAEAVVKYPLQRPEAPGIAGNTKPLQERADSAGGGE